MSALRQSEVEDLIAADLRAGRGGWLVTANLDHLRRFDQDPLLRPLVESSDLVVADGMPLVWASHIAGDPLPERVAGSDLIYTLSDRAARAGAGVFLLGGSSRAAGEAAHELARRNPSIRIAGTLCPPLGFEQDPDQMADIAAAIHEADPGLVFVGLGFPKQDRVIAALRETHPCAWYVGCGVSIDFAAGFVRRAPRWMQRTGGEWLFRLVNEPKKLTQRYVRYGLPFLVRLTAWAIAQRLRRRTDARSTGDGR